MMVRAIAIGVLCLALQGSASAQSKNSQLDDCIDAVDLLNETLEDIAARLKQYTTCLSTSKGRNDCAPDFKRLQKSQSAYEMAVHAHRKNCD